MPGMIRTNMKAARVCWKLLGKPANMRSSYSPYSARIRSLVRTQDNTFVR